MKEPTFMPPDALVDALSKSRNANIALPRQRVRIDEASYPDIVFKRMLACDLLYVFRQFS